jgi:hypothetical protein
MALIRCSFCNQFNPTPAPIYRPVNAGAGSRDGNGICAEATPEIDERIVAARRRFRVMTPVLQHEGKEHSGQSLSMATGSRSAPTAS